MHLSYYIEYYYPIKINSKKKYFILWRHIVFRYLVLRQIINFNRIIYIIWKYQYLFINNYNIVWKITKTNKNTCSFPILTAVTYYRV